MQKASSAFSTSWSTENVALWDSTTVSDTFRTLNVFMTRSGYSSWILPMSRVPKPEPVPPPIE